MVKEDETDEDLPEMIFDGDILRRNNSDLTLAHAPLANPKMLWPGGEVEYKWYRTFPRCVFVLFASFLLLIVPPESTGEWCWKLWATLPLSLPASHLCQPPRRVSTTWWSTQGHHVQVRLGCKAGLRCFSWMRSALTRGWPSPSMSCYMLLALSTSTFGITDVSMLLLYTHSPLHSWPSQKMGVFAFVTEASVTASAHIDVFLAWK